MSVMQDRGLGYRPDQVDKRDFDFQKLGLASPSDETEFTLMQFEPPIYNQGSSSTCVGQALAGAIHNRENQAASRGVDIEPANPARLAIYYNSRVIHTVGRIEDTGTFLRTGAQGMFRVGCPDESLWRFSTRKARINRRPSMGATIRGMGRKGGKYYRILEAGDGRIEGIVAALQAGHPVCFGTRVNEDFLNSNGPGVIEKPNALGRFAGGHAMSIVGYHRTMGETMFLVRNSWGTDWRRDGYAWLREEYIRWFQSSDFQIIVGWDLLQENV